MTPAETLLAAADQVQAWADPATPGPWRVIANTDDQWFIQSPDNRLNVEVFAHDDRRMDFDRTAADAAWIAGLGPHNAPHLAKWLREEAELADSIGINMNAIALARSILREQS